MRGHNRGDPAGEVTGYWLSACSVTSAKVNGRASHLFTPVPAPDRESNGIESRRRTSGSMDYRKAYLQVAKVFDCLYCSRVDTSDLRFCLE